MILHRISSRDEIPYLFSGENFDALLENQKRSIKARIEGWSENHAVSMTIEEHISSLVSNYNIEIPTIDKNSISTDKADVKIDVTNDPARVAFSYRGDHERVIISGTCFIFHVPYNGPRRGFTFNPYHFLSNPPIGEILDTEIIIKIYCPSDSINPEEVKQDFQQQLEKIETTLTGLKNKYNQFASDLINLIRPLVENRVKKFQADNEALEGLGFPLKKYQTAPRIYTIPIEKKTVSPIVDTIKSNPISGNYTITNNTYEEILNMLQSMSLVIERSPEAFSQMEEEHIRFVLLVPLNAQFKGAARGEVFNVQGKTDILVTHEDKNLFIAECKFWGGAKVLSQTIDQILSYTSWRDSKTAILLFNKNKNSSKVLEEIPKTVKLHSTFASQEEYNNETGFRFTLKNVNDENKLLTLTILLFDIPTK